MQIHNLSEEKFRLMNSTILAEIKKVLKITAAALFWIAVWHFAAQIIDKAWVLPTPWRVLQTFLELAKEQSFWISIKNSVFNVILGYFYGAIFGGVLAVVSHFVTFVNVLISPVLTVMRATPVASFIMLLWVFVNKEIVPSLIVILIVLPIVYGNLSAGLSSVDKKHLELAKVYDFSFGKKMKYIYAPQTLPYIKSALSTSLGLAWKAGIAAEVLCDPLNSIGHGIFSSKRDILTADLFAWTAVVILLCFIFEFVLARIFSIKFRKDANR